MDLSLCSNLAFSFYLGDYCCICISSLCAFATLRLCVEFFVSQFARSAGYSRTPAKMTLAKMQRRIHGKYPLHWRLTRLQPPCKNVNSAGHSPTAASHFGGKMANYANKCAICAELDFRGAAQIQSLADVGIVSD
jgi:hypothetical protein